MPFSGGHFLDDLVVGDFLSNYDSLMLFVDDDLAILHRGRCFLSLCFAPKDFVASVLFDMIPPSPPPLDVVFISVGAVAAALPAYSVVFDLLVVAYLCLQSYCMCYFCFNSSTVGL